jgi:hypothetical protein
VIGFMEEEYICLATTIEPLLTSDSGWGSGYAGKWHKQTSEKDDHEGAGGWAWTRGRASSLTQLKLQEKRGWWRGFACCQAEEKVNIGHAKALLDLHHLMIT